MTVTRQESLEKISELIKGIKVAMLTTVNAEGDFHSRPMYTQENEFDGDVWFFSEKSSSKVTDIERNPRANASYAKGSSYVSLAGNALIVTDVAKKQALWNEALKVWFKNGPTDPNVVLIKISSISAEYWDENAPGGLLGTVISYATALITGNPDAVGVNETVQLK